jgi:hypothetical protein
MQFLVMGIGLFKSLLVVVHTPLFFFSSSFFFLSLCLSLPCLVLTPGLLVIKRALVSANVISKGRFLAEWKGAGEH